MFHPILCFWFIRPRFIFRCIIYKFSFVFLHFLILNILACKITKLKQTNQACKIFNSLKIKMIKMTFFDMKDVVFVIKIVNCKKKMPNCTCPCLR